jgi:hypothetical protein
MSSTRTDRRSGSLAGLRPCMVMHVGNSGGSRAWQGMLGHRPDGESTHPRSTSVLKGSVTASKYWILQRLDRGRGAVVN